MKAERSETSAEQGNKETKLGPARDHENAPGRKLERGLAVKVVFLARKRVGLKTSTTRIGHEEHEGHESVRGW